MVTRRTMLRGSVATAVALTLRPGFAGIAGVLPGGAQSAAANATWFGAVLPTLPNQFTTTSAPPAPANTNRGSYYTPGVGGDASLTLQQAIDDAAAATGSLGDVIVVQAGTTYSTAGTLTIPARSGSGWVYVISSDAPELGGSGLPAAGTRVGPSNVANMGSIRNSASSTGGNVVVFSAQAAYYRFVGCDIEVQDINATGGSVYFCCNLGNTSTYTYTTTAELVNHVTFDRCFIDGSPSYGAEHGITIDGKYIEVTECYFGDNIFSVNVGDNQCVNAYNSSGPYKVTNNRLHCGGQTILFGGADSSIPYVIPSDLVFQNNTCVHWIWEGTITVSAGSTTMTVDSTTSGNLRISMKITDASGALQDVAIVGGSGTTWTLASAPATAITAGSAIAYEGGKNMIEMKCVQRALIDHNYCDNPGGLGQSYSMLATVRNQSGTGTNTLNTVSDLTVTNNAFINDAFAGWNVLLQDNTNGGNFDTAPSYRHLYRNNLFLFTTPAKNSSGVPIEQIAIQVESNGVPPGSAGIGGDIVWDHNTFIFLDGGTEAIFFAATGMALNNLVWTNNIFDATTYEIHGSPGSGYTAVVVPQVTEPAYLNNVVIAGTQTYPSGNFISTQAAVGFTSYGSSTAASGYVLTSGSPYYQKGVSGLGLPYTSSGIADGTDIGANISLLPVN